jgi:flagellar biosynthesis/type III secretory pathway chaperone
VRDCRDNVIDVSNQVMTNTIIYQNTAKPIIDTTDLFTSYVQNDERERSSFFNELIKDLNYKYDKLSEKYEELKDQQNKNAQVIDELLAKVNKMNELLDKQSELFVQNMLHHTFSNNSLPSVQLLQYKTRQRPLSISIGNQY